MNLPGIKRKETVGVPKTKKSLFLSRFHVINRAAFHPSGAEGAASPSPGAGTAGGGSRRGYKADGKKKIHIYISKLPFSIFSANYEKWKLTHSKEQKKKEENPLKWKLRRVRNAAARVPLALRGMGGEGGALGLSVPPGFQLGRGNPPRNGSPAALGPVVQAAGWESHQRPPRPPDLANSLPRGCQRGTWGTRAGAKSITAARAGTAGGEGCRKSKQEDARSLENGPNPKFRRNGAGTQPRRSTGRSREAAASRASLKKTQKSSPPHPRGRKRA